MDIAGHILFADDSLEFRRPMTRLLEEEGFAVTSVGDAEGALEALAGSQTIDVLLADIYMPGNETLELLRAVDGRIPVIILTGTPTVGTAVEALRQAAFDYLVKPVDPGNLVKRAHAAVEKARKLRSLEASRMSLTSMAAQLSALEAALSGAGDAAHLPATGDRPGNPIGGLTREERAALSPRELEVVTELARGMRVSEVAARLFISPHTVRNHLKSVFRKLGVSSQVELLAKLSGAGP